MIVSINQPAFLPWLGYFDRIKKSDVHVILDHVQFEKNSMMNRNRILAKSGEILLTIPVNTKGKFNNLVISNLEIANQRWIKKSLRAIQQTYCRHPHFKSYFPFVEAAFNKQYTRLFELQKELNNYFFGKLEIDTKIVCSSDMDCQCTKSELVLEICHELQASTYISGPFGRDYLDLESFEDSQIGVYFHDYEHPVYPQMNSLEFQPHMCILDLLFNEGPQSANYFKREL